MDVLAILLSLVTLVAGAFAGYLYGRRRASAEAGRQARTEEQLALSSARQEVSRALEEASRARAEAAAVRSEAAQHLAEKADLRTAAMDAQRQLAEARGETAGVAAQVAALTAQRDAAVQKAAEQAQDREVLLTQFKALSADSLERQGRQADEVAEHRLKATEQLVGPLADGLRQLQEKLQSVEKDRIRMAAELGEQVQAVRLSGDAIRKETVSLSNALRSPQVRGAWGERSLKRIVEISGLTERCDFDAQATYTSDDGRFRPDMRINLPAGKVIFVDSKVPLSAVLEAYNTEDEDAQKAYFKTFAGHVRKHIDDLSGKHYWQLDLGSPEFVVLYLPSDEFYRLALEQDPALHDFATRRQIVLASPGLLIPQLQIVANGWQQVSLAETAGQVSKLGRELYERLATLGQHFDKLGRSLGSAVSNYNKAVGAVETRVMVSARRFKDLGVTSGELPELAPVTETAREIAVPEMLEFEDLRSLERAAVADEAELLDQPSVRQLRRRTGTDDA
ncbi:DNA recombination protein RmuC [Tessaracoccus sp. Z1128]